MFVSYTTDLDRAVGPGMTWVGAARRAIGARRHAGVHMTLFDSHAVPPADTCLTEIADCQVWVGILGHGYGSLLPDGSTSYTEMEFEAACSNDLVRFTYRLDDDVAVPGLDDQTCQDAERQRDFRDRAQRSSITVGTVRTPDDVFADLVVKLADPRIETPAPTFRNRPPLVLAVDDPLDHGDAEELRTRLLAHEDRVVVLTGDGGVGKTSLVSTVFDALLHDRTPRAFGVLDYVSASGHVWITGDTLLHRLRAAVRSATAADGLDRRWTQQRVHQSRYADNRIPQAA